MNIRFESKGNFEKVTAWLEKASRVDASNALKAIAIEGERALAANTPKDTGETASGWTSEITGRGATAEIVWKNRAHPELNVNLAKLIDQGHGTGTGGYVPPRPFIKRSMDKVWKNAGDTIVKELNK